MPKPAIFTADEAAFLRELAARKVEFMIVGLSAAALQGVPAVTQDIDHWFKDLEDPRIAASVRAVGGALVPQTGLSPPLLAGKAVALFAIVLSMHGLKSFEEEAAGALRVRLGRLKVLVLPLSRILAGKKALRPPKDKLTIPLLEDALAVIESRAPKPGPRNPRPGRGAGVRGPR